MTLATTITASIKATQSGTPDLGTSIAALDKTVKILLADGVLANQATKVFADTRTLAASATENIDVNGVLFDSFNTAVTLTAVKALLIAAKSTNTNNVIVGGAASNGLLGIFNDPTDKIIVKPGGAFLWCAPATGATVTPATGDILLVANSAGGTAVDYDIIVIGI